MLKLKERYIVDERGDRVAVMLDISDYRKLLALAGQTESAIVDVDEAMSLAGIGESHQPLIESKAVSEHPDLYLYSSPRKLRPHKATSRNGRKRKS
jgi:hypothetical protein